jgi:hypothetical protein
MSIASFFTKLTKPDPPPPKRKVGRPSLKAKATEEAQKLALEAAEEEEWQRVAEMQDELFQKAAAEAARRTAKRDAGHTNWSLPENAAILRPAVDGWLDGSAKRDGFSLPSWAAKCGIPVGTLSNYTTRNVEKRKIVGVGPGKKPKMASEKVSVLVDAIVRADWGNHPKSLAEVVDTIQELDPGLSRKQARDAGLRKGSS